MDSTAKIQGPESLLHYEPPISVEGGSASGAAAEGSAASGQLAEILNSIFPPRLGQSLCSSSEHSVLYLRIVLSRRHFTFLLFPFLPSCSASPFSLTFYPHCAHKVPTLPSFCSLQHF